MGCASCNCKAYPKIAADAFDLSRNYKLMVIGESPTGVEVRKKEVMTGQGAKVLKATMDTVGLPTSPEVVYYTTALKCAVPKQKGKRISLTSATKNCREYLLNEIKQVNPELILVCGSVALTTLTGNSKIKITEEYGRVREYDWLLRKTENGVEHVKVIPIMNPGVLLHKPGDYKPFLAMLQLASTIFSGGSTIDTGETTWTVCETKEEVLALWTKMHKENIQWCAMDVETTGLDYRTAEFLVLGICFEKNHTHIIPREMQQYVHNFIEDVPWKTVWQHGKYDKKVLWRRELGDVEIGGDTMYQHYVLDETSAHDLGYLSKTFLNAEEYKYKMNQNWKSVSLETYPQFFDALCERAAVDCDYQLQLFHRFNEILDQEDNKSLRKLYDELIIPAANFLGRVEQTGILLDEDYLNEMDERYTIQIAEIRKEIEKLAYPFWSAGIYQHQTGAKSAPEKFNPGSPQQLSWMVFDRLKLRPRIKRGRSTAKEVLDSIENPPALIRKVREYRSVQKEHSTYIKGLLGAMDTDGRVRSTFNLHITSTGRLSSKEPNVQNQPAANTLGNTRKAFTAPKGRVIAEIDYAGAELRWLAILSGCPVLTDIFIQDRNLHDETSIALFGENFTERQRMRAKAINFGIPYGITAPSIAKEHSITNQEAQDMIDGWNKRYHGASAYLNWCAEQVVEGNYLETPFGRRRRFGLVSQSSLHALQNEARNFPIQSSSSDLLLECSILMEQTLLEKYDTKIVNLVHDSNLLEIPADKQTLMEVGKYANTIMTQRPIEKFDSAIPFKTDFEVGFNWGELIPFNWQTGEVTLYTQDGIKRLDFDEWYKEKIS